MATIPKAGISTSSTIEATHVTNIIDALDGTTSREIKIPGSAEVTGSLKTNGVNTHSGVNTFSGQVNLNNILNLTDTSSGIQTRLVQLNNSSPVTVALSDYPYGTTFEIDLSQDTDNDIGIRLGECPNDQISVRYHILFSKEAAGAGARLILINTGGEGVKGLNSNSNANFTITASTGAATSAITDLVYSRVQLTNIQETPHWFMQTWSDNASTFTIT
jgi:hypothetical protein